MVVATSQATETPVELAALIALGITASTVAGKVEVNPEQGYFEPLNLYTSPTMESGNRKTAVMNRLAAPLVAYESCAIDLAKPELQKLLSLRRTSEARIDRLRKKA